MNRTYVLGICLSEAALLEWPRACSAASLSGNRAAGAGSWCVEAVAPCERLGFDTQLRSRVMEDIKVHRYGTPTAAPVVLIHGLTEAGTCWPDLVGHWEEQWDIHAPDLRGHGTSPRFSVSELGDASAVLLADVVGLLEGFTTPVVLVGHSLGGLLALRAALARPDKVRALVLEDPAKPSGSTPDPEFVAANETFLESMADPTCHPQRVASMLAETTWSRPEAEAWAACKPLVDRAYVREGLSLGSPEWERVFNRLAVPTLLLVPPGSEMAPQAHELHNPAIRTVVVPDSGHCLRRDQPERYHREVDAFLRTVDEWRLMVLRPDTP